MNQALQDIVERELIPHTEHLALQASKLDPVMQKGDDSSDYWENSIVNGWFDKMLWEELVMNTGRFFRIPGNYEDDLISYVWEVLNSQVSDICIKLDHDIEPGDIIVEMKTRMRGFSGEGIITLPRPRIGVLLEKKPEDDHGNSFSYSYSLGTYAYGGCGIATKDSMHENFARLLISKNFASSGYEIRTGDLVVFKMDSEVYRSLEEVQERYEARIGHCSGRKKFPNQYGPLRAGSDSQIEMYVVIGYEGNELALLPVEIIDGKITCKPEQLGMLQDTIELNLLEQKKTSGASPYVVAPQDHLIKVQMPEQSAGGFPQKHYTPAELDRMVRQTVYDLFDQNGLFYKEEFWRQMLISAERAGKQEGIRDIFAEMKVDLEYFKRFFELADHVRGFEGRRAHYAGSN